MPVSIFRKPTRVVSPKGVREVFQVVPTNNKNHSNSSNNAFNKKATTKKRKDQPKSPIRPTQVTTHKSISPPTLSELKMELQQVRDRLEWVKNQSEKDKEELYEGFIQEKARVRKEMREKFEPLMKPTDKNIDIRVRETAKIIQFLRDDNARIRDEIKYHHRMIADMKSRNAALEETNAKVAETYASLNAYVNTMEETNVRLVKNTNIYKNHLKVMKDKMKVRNDYFEAEANSSDLYEEAVAKIITHVGTHCRDPKLIQIVIDSSDEAVKIAHSGKKSELKKVGATEVPMTKRRSSKKRRPSGIDCAYESDSDDDESDYDSDEE